MCLCVCSYEQELSEAAEHVVCVLDGRDRPVGTTTYLHLHQLIEQIRNTNYFAGKRNGTSHEELATAVAGPTAVPETLTSVSVHTQSIWGNDMV